MKGKNTSYLSKDITAEILFDHFSYFQKSLIKYFGKYKNLIFREGVTIPFHLTYLCPLCLKNYIVFLGNDLNVNSIFTLDHIPPQSVEGTFKLITCKTCNNNAGKYEAELERKLNYDTFSKRQSPAIINDTKFKIEGITGNYASYIKTSEDGIPTIDFPSKANHKTPFLDEWLSNLDETQDWTVTFTLPTPNEEKFLKALLKSAYLLCFFYWGYEFAYSENGELIRKVLNDETKYAMNGPAFWIDKNNLQSEIVPPLGLGLIDKPTELQSYYVNLPIERDNVSYIATVLIPNPTRNGWAELERIHSWLTQNPQKQITFRPISLSLPDTINGYNENWNSFINLRND